MALLGSKSTKDEESIIEEEQKKPDSPQLRPIDNPELVDDHQYFFEDRPPTPLFIPLPPGIETGSQIEDGELFDYDITVEPILEVLVGRSLIHAQYEIIEEEERSDYLSHKKHYDQRREFEFVNLQRMEAAHIRREDERRRRRIQKVERQVNDVIIQQKLF